MKRLLILFMFLLGSLAVHAQSVEVGATFDSSSSPNKSAYASYLHPLGAGFYSYSTLSMWQSNVNQISHSLVTGVEKPLFASGAFTLAAHVQAGEATSQNAFSGNFNGGGSLLITPKFLKGHSFVISGSATDTPATGAWYPKVSAGFRYVIHP